jgi:hypothetical protein
VHLAPLGAFFNMVRGGLLPIEGGKSINIAVFAAVSGFVVEYWWQVPLCALAMYAGQQPSTGEFVGTILNRELENPDETNYWDAVIGKLKSYPLIYAHVGAALRGLYWGALIALAAWTPWPALAGLTLGLSYELAYRFSKPSIAWKVGEGLFGAILWGSL